MQTVSCSTVSMRRWKRHELWTCTNYCRGHTPHSKQLAPTIKCAMVTFSPCSNIATWLLTGMIKNRPSASCCLAGLSKRVCRSVDNVFLWPEVLRSLFIVHTALQFWPILSLVVRTFSMPAPCVHSNRAHPRCVSMPSCNNTDHIRKMIVWKIFSLHTV